MRFSVMRSEPLTPSSARDRAWSRWASGERFEDARLVERRCVAALRPSSAKSTRLRPVRAVFRLPLLFSWQVSCPFRIWLASLAWPPLSWRGLCRLLFLLAAALGRALRDQRRAPVPASPISGSSLFGHGRIGRAVGDIGAVAALHHLDRRRRSRIGAEFLQRLAARGACSLWPCVSASSVTAWLRPTVNTSSGDSSEAYCRRCAT